jgi:chromatin segregation and condensation protein Rec8/ScpA/Scc1 (kleisin family)
MRYALYRDSAISIIESFGKAVAHERLFVPDKTPMFVTDNFTTVSALEQAIGEVLVNLPKKEIKPKVQVRKVVSLEEMIDRLHKRIENALKLRFSELLEDAPERSTVIVGFLAILESVKQGSILVAQVNHFDDIEITREQTGLPRYM